MIYKITANICGNETRRQICCQGYLDRSCSSKNSSKSTMSNQKKEATSLTIEATVSLPDMLTNNNIFGNARIHSIVCPKCVHGDMITGEILDIQPTDIRPYTIHGVLLSSVQNATIGGMSVGTAPMSVKY